MACSNCGSDLQCHCLVVAGNGVSVTGTGNANPSDPYLIASRLVTPAGELYPLTPSTDRSYVGVAKLDGDPYGYNASTGEWIVPNSAPLEYDKALTEPAQQPPDSAAPTFAYYVENIGGVDYATITHVWDPGNTAWVSLQTPVPGQEIVVDTFDDPNKAGLKPDDESAPAIYRQVAQGCVKSDWTWDPTLNGQWVEPCGSCADPCIQAAVRMDRHTNDGPFSVDDDWLDAACAAVAAQDEALGVLTIRYVTDPASGGRIGEVDPISKTWTEIHDGTGLTAGGVGDPGGALNLGSTRDKRGVFISGGELFVVDLNQANQAPTHGPMTGASVPDNPAWGAMHPDDARFIAAGGGTAPQTLKAVNITTRDAKNYLTATGYSGAGGDICFTGDGDLILVTWDDGPDPDETYINLVNPGDGSTTLLNGGGLDTGAGSDHGLGCAWLSGTVANSDLKILVGMSNSPADIYEWDQATNTWSLWASLPTGENLHDLAPFIAQPANPGAASGSDQITAASFIFDIANSIDPNSATGCVEYLVPVDIEIAGKTTYSAVLGIGHAYRLAAYLDGELVDTKLLDNRDGNDPTPFGAMEIYDHRGMAPGETISPELTFEVHCIARPGLYEHSAITIDKTKLTAKRFPVPA